MAQMVKNLPAVQETQVLRSLGQEDSPEDVMATHSRTGEPSGLWSMGPTVHGLQESDVSEQLSLSFTWHQILNLKLYMHYLCNPHKNPLGLVPYCHLHFTDVEIGVQRE